jgi:hypothetical protein
VGSWPRWVGEGMFPYPLKKTLFYIILVRVVKYRTDLRYRVSVPEPVRYIDLGTPISVRVNPVKGVTFT